MIADNDLLSSSRCSDLVVRADNDNLLDSCTDCGDVARDDIVDQVRRSGKLMQKKKIPAYLRYLLQILGSVCHEALAKRI